MASTELVTASKYDLEGVSEAAEIWREELGDDFVPTFPRIKVPAGGSTTWEIDEDTPPTRELTAIVVAHHKSSRLYLESFDDSSDAGKRPDAWSTDGKVQVVPPETYAKIDALNAKNGTNLPYPSTDLKQCPYYQFESAATLLGGSGVGKATREYRELYLLIEGNSIPYQLSVPATSLKAWDQYAANQVMKNRRLSGIETVITLDKVKGSGSVEYSKVEFRKGADLEPELAKQALAFARGVKALVTRDPFVARAEGTDATAVGETVEAAVSTPAPQQAAQPAAEPVAAGAAATTDDDDIDF